MSVPREVRVTSRQILDVFAKSIKRVEIKGLSVFNDLRETEGKFFRCIMI